MRTKVRENILYIHLDMVETEELEQTGFAIVSDEDDINDELCVTCINDELMNNHYQVWFPIDYPQYDGYEIKLSYTPNQEEETF